MSRLQRLTEATRRPLNEADHKALGDFRRSAPTEAPQTFRRIDKAAKDYHKKLANFLNSLEHKEGRELKMALYALQRDIKKWGGQSPESVAPMSMQIYALLQPMGDQTEYAKLLSLLRGYLKSNELNFGGQKIT